MTTVESTRRTVPRWRRPKAPGWRRIKLPRTATEAERRQAAISHYYETGDSGPAHDMGVEYPDRRQAARQLRRFSSAMVEITELRKVAPGPPPRPGLEWKEETSRWVRPQRARPQKPKARGKPTVEQSGIEQPGLVRTPGTTKGVPTHSKATGDELQHGVDYSSWEVPAYTRGGTKRQLGEAVEATRVVMANLQPKYQRLFASLVDRTPLAVYSAGKWQSFMSNVYSESSADYAIMKNGGALYLHGQGVHFSHNQAEHTHEHEYGHLLAEQVFQANRSPQLGSLYRQAQLRGSAVTSYALSNEHEYFAEGFAHYIQQPEVLKAKDPEMYKYVSQYLQ